MFQIHLGLPPFFSIIFLILNLIFSLSIPSLLSANVDRRYETCASVINTTCGHTQIDYPFWFPNTMPEYCGHPDFKVNCTDESLTMEISNHTFSVVKIDYDAYVLTISNPSFINNPCPLSMTNSSLDLTLFNLASSSQNATLFYDCSSSSVDKDAPYGFTCPTSVYSVSTTSNLAFLATEKKWEQILGGVCNVRVYNPVLKSSVLGLASNSSNITEVLKMGFDVKFKYDDKLCDTCESSGGVCGYNYTLNQPACFCTDGAYGGSCNDPQSRLDHIQSPGGRRVAATEKTLLPQNMVESITNEGGLTLFTMKKLSIATNNFGEDNKLGQGGFGPVYKGKLEDSSEVAIKRLSKASGQGLQEFMNEVLVISKLQHRNLVKLLGCCAEGEEKILIYEYMPNMSLDSLLFDPLHAELLDWKKRYNIIVGICRGLLYLHRDSRLRIIHRDLKSSNVLLDANLNPKISDFGMARIFCDNQDQADTNRVVGTYGYMSPEYAMEGRFSEKSDVFSFGVLLLEIISGRRNGNFKDNQSLSLLEYAWRLWNEDDILSLIDPRLSDSRFHEEIMRCIQLGLLCVQEFPDDRPSIADILSMVDAELKDIPRPSQPGFILRKALPRTELFENVSVNHVSITATSGR